MTPVSMIRPMRRFPYWKMPLPIRRSWRGYTGGLNDTPFRLRFPNLDPDSHYKVRVVYSDTEEEIKVRLVANETIEIHPFIAKKIPPQTAGIRYSLGSNPPGQPGIGVISPTGQRRPGSGAGNL